VAASRAACYSCHIPNHVHHYVKNNAARTGIILENVLSHMYIVIIKDIPFVTPSKYHIHYEQR